MIKLHSGFCSAARSSSAIVTTAMMFSLLTFGDALAQAEVPASATADQPSAATSGSAKIDDAKLDQFADAYLAIQAIQKETAEKQAATKDPNAISSLTSEAQSKMSNAVVAAGLQVEEFNQISQLMLSDMELRNKVTAKVQARAKPGV